ncbi:MAG TPA: response regulator transcription factor [Vicinamibacterales bacterium]
MKKLRIVVADDHTLVRQGLRKILETQPDWEVIAEAGDGRDAIRETIERQPDVVILDIAMPRLNGVEAVQQIVRRAPGVRVLVLSMYVDEAYVTRAVRGGALGYLLKDSADIDLIRAVTAVSQGKSFFSPAVAKIILDEYGRQMAEKGVTDRYDTLSEREREVFQLVAEGLSNKEVAEMLHISPATVETHRARLMEKLDIHSTAELVLCAVRKGVIR